MKAVTALLDGSRGYMVPTFAVLLLWLRRHHLKLDAITPTWWGAIFLAATEVSAFVVCPMMSGMGMIGQVLPWQQVYLWAAEQARAAAKPSRWERCVAFSSN